jgi:hypothetical protein
VTETLETGLIKYNNDESLVTETLETGLIKYNTDETLVTETLVTGLIKYNTDESQGFHHYCILSSLLLRSQ